MLQIDKIYFENARNLMSSIDSKFVESNRKFLSINQLIQFVELTPVVVQATSFI